MITQAIVKEFLNYNEHTGVLRWLPRDVSWFKSSKEWKRWNTRYAGKPAFTYFSQGWRQGCILNQHYLAHRVVWLWMTGRHSTAIRFRNGDHTDLRFSNLVEHDSPAAVREWLRSERAAA
jgi:hypothetical protein